MIDRTFNTPGPLALDLSLPSGTIEVETVDGNETHVTLAAADERSLEDARVELREDDRGHELCVDLGRRPRAFGGIHIQLGGFSLGEPSFVLRVRCPHGARLAVKTASARIDARGTYGGGDVRTVSGDVTLDRIDGALRLNSVSGDATAGAALGTIDARSVSGDLKLEASEGVANVRTVSGDVEVAIASGSRVYVDASSVTGALDSELELADSQSDEGDSPLVELRAKTVSGDVRVVRAAMPAASRAGAG